MIGLDGCCLEIRMQSFIKRLLEEVSKQLERHPLHDETAHREMLDGLSQSLGSLSSASPELTVIEGGDDESEALSKVEYLNKDEFFKINSDIQGENFCYEYSDLI